MKTTKQLRDGNRMLRAEIRLLKLVMNQLSQERRTDLILESLMKLSLS
jgi:hypothetical protein